MTVENFEAQTDPNGTGQDAGATGNESTQENAAPQQPAARTYTEAEVNAREANARRAWEYQTQQQITRERQNWQTQQRQAQPAAKPDDPWAAFDPQAAQALRTAFDKLVEERIAPFKSAQETYIQQQEDLAFKSEEADLKSKYPDYAKNRTAVLEFAVANGIPNAEAAFHAWRSMTQWDNLSNQAVTNHLSKKASQAARTPSTEGRGGAPSSKQSFKGQDGKLDREAMDEAAKQLFRDSEQS